jgi:hypothetical protein
MVWFKKKQVSCLLKTKDMSKTLILAVHPVWRDYSKDQFERQLRKIIKQCQGSFVAYATMENIDFYSEFDYGDDDYKEDNSYSDQITNSYRDPYWSNLLKSLEDEEIYASSVGYYNLPEKINCNESQHDQVEKNYEEARLYFHNLFSMPRKLRRDAINSEYEVILADIHIGYNLHRTFPEEFRISCLFPDTVDEQLAFKLVEKRRREFLYFQKWHRNVKPTIIGNWRVKPSVQNYGKFYLYASSLESKEDPLKMIPTNGIISDRYGLAYFEGKINKHVLEFQKYYFELATENIEMWDGRVINYRIFRGTGNGVYWVKENVENECIVEFG